MRLKNFAFGVVVWSAVSAFASEIPRSETLDQFCQSITKSGFSGVVLAIRNNKVVLQQGYGLANQELGNRNTPQTLFEIASLSKQFTATAILKLEQDGRLSIDDPIGQHLPGVPNSYETVTIHQLLTHTGGLPAGGPGRGLDLEHAVRSYLDQPPVAKPGAKYSYSNVGYALLAGIVEQASGTSFEAYCRDMLFTPAGMTATGFCGQDFDNAKLAMGYSSRRDPPRLPNVDPYSPEEQFGYEYRGMGGVVTNAIDLARWCKALKDQTILEKSAKATLFTPVTKMNACGWEVFNFPDGRQCIGHGGSVQGYTCKLWMFPEDQSLLLVLSNNDEFDYSWLNGMYTILFDAPERKSNQRALQSQSENSPLAHYGLQDNLPATDSELIGFIGEYTSSNEVPLRLNIRKMGDGLTTEITPPLHQAPPENHQELRLLTKNIIDGLGSGDVEPIATTMMPDIPTRWPETIRTKVWAPHLERFGEYEGHDILGVEPMAGTEDIVLVWVRLRHANGETVAMVGYRGVRLQLLVLNISDYFCPPDGLLFFKHPYGNLIAEYTPYSVSIISPQPDGSVVLQSRGMTLSFEPD